MDFCNLSAVPSPGFDDNQAAPPSSALVDEAGVNLTDEGGTQLQTE